MNSKDVNEVEMYYRAFERFFDNCWPFATSLEHIERHYEYLKEKS